MIYIIPGMPPIPPMPGIPPPMPGIPPPIPGIPTTHAAHIVVVIVMVIVTRFDRLIDDNTVGSQQ